MQIQGVLIRKATKKVSRKSLIDKEFKKWLGGALKEDAEILGELAKR